LKDSLPVDLICLEAYTIEWADSEGSFDRKAGTPGIKLIVNRNASRTKLTNLKINEIDAKQWLV
jgi:hypothetical protein